MSVQNVSYHLDNLEDAGVVEVADTRYSEKGKEMNLYAPADDPVVVFVGTEERKAGFLSLLKRLVGATGLLLLGSVLLYIYHGFGLGLAAVMNQAFGHCCQSLDLSSFSVDCSSSA